MTHRYDIPIPVGAKVRFDGRDDGVPEYGVVTACWYDETMRVCLCTALFTPGAPWSGNPDEDRYALQCAAPYLVLSDEDWNEAPDPRPSRP